MFRESISEIGDTTSLGNASGTDDVFMQLRDVLGLDEYIMS